MQKPYKYSHIYSAISSVIFKLGALLSIINIVVAYDMTVLPNAGNPSSINQVTHYTFASSQILGPVTQGSIMAITFPP
jgi:hypothetical protein